MASPSEPLQLVDQAAPVAPAAPAPAATFGKKGAKPAFMAARQPFSAPRVLIERTKDLPVVHSSTTLAADKALLDSQAKARALKKITLVPGGGKSVKGVEMVLPSAAASAAASADIQKPKAAPSLLSFFAGKH